MNKKILIALTILILLVMAFFFLPGKKEELAPEPSDIEGIIFSKVESRILIAKSEYSRDAIWLAVEEAEITGEDGEALSFNDLRVGDRVEAWIAGTIAESYPRQAKAEKIKVKESKGISLECEELTGEERDRCYLEIASSQSELLACDMVSDELSRDLCYRNIAISKEDSSICPEISNEEERDYCYSGVAVRKKDASLCEKVSNPVFKKSCQLGAKE